MFFVSVNNKVNMKSKIIEKSPERLANKSFFWRQMSTNGKVRVFTIKNFFLSPILKIFFRRKKTWCHTAPILIIGQNTWLNSLLAWRLSKDNNEIWVWDVHGLDWWNYSVIGSSSFLNFCKAKFPYIKIQSIYGLIRWLRAQACDASNIYLLPPTFTPKEMYKDEYTNGWVFKIQKGEWPEMSGVKNIEQNRRHAKEKIDKEPWPTQAIRATWPEKVEHNADDEYPCHYLMAMNVIWTSLPPSGVEYGKSEDESYIRFDLPNQKTFGCASKIAQTPESFLKQPFEEMEEVILGTLSGD
jgi:hypothetical protein